MGKNMNHMGRHSIKFKITILMAVIFSALIVLLLVFNNTQSERFYLADKQKSMLSTYHKIDDVINQYDNESLTDTQMKDSLDQLTTSASVSVIVINSDWTTAYSNINGEKDMLDRLIVSIFNNDVFHGSEGEQNNGSQPQKGSGLKPHRTENNGGSDSSDSDQSANGDSQNPDNVQPPDNNGLEGDKPDTMPGLISINMSGSGVDESREIIEKTDKYTLQKIYDHRLGDDYYELWGTLSNGESIMIRLAIQGIKDSVKLFNSFITYVGIAILFIGIIVAFVFSSYIAKPIMQLSNIAKRMSGLDFDARYEGKDKGEIGVLGNSMNYMSTKLEENISHLKAANAELQRDIDRKTEIDEMRTDFLSNVSHELKTPIALIQGYAEGLKDGITEDPESMDYYCDVIIDEAYKMNNLVKKLLTLNQIEFGNEELVMDRFDIVELISGIINANQLRASQKGITINFKQKDEVIDVWSDEYKIEEVITNYITNAINHCDFEKIIDVRVEAMGDNVRVYVFNTGKNIPDEDINNIWTKFYKVDKARTREYGGNGIGLSIVKAIMDSYGKECGVSNLENGVEFWFDLDAKAMV